MKRLTLLAVACSAAAVIGAGGAGSAYGLSASADDKSAMSAGGGGAEEFQCISNGLPVADSAPGPDQACVITGSTGTCIERSDAPLVVQTCTFTQTTGDTDKRAKVIQVAATNKGPSPQKHTQRVEITQLSVNASNFVDVSQTVKQSLGPGHFDDTDEAELESTSSTSPTPIETHQDFHQVVTVNQTTGTGNNASAISQFGKQRARAKHAPSISQFQNTMPAANAAETCPAPADDQNANQCSVVSQTSGSGENQSRLDGTYLQFARAQKTTMNGTQQQGFQFGAGGLEHDITQNSTGFCKITTSQTERQVLRAVQADETQIQHGPTRKGSGSSQNCNSDSLWNGTQDSSQLATSRPKEEDVGSLVYSTSPALQNNLMEYFGFTDGDIRANQSVKHQTNNQRETETNSCPSPSSPANEPNHFCAAVITCQNADVDLTAAASAAPTDPGRCEAFEGGG